MIFKQCGKQASVQKTYKSQQNVTFHKVYDFLAEKLVDWITYVIWLISEWNIHTGVISWQADISGNAGAADDIFWYAQTVDHGPGYQKGTQKPPKANKTDFQFHDDATASMIQVRLTNEALTPPDVLGLSGISMDTQKKKAQTTVEAVNAQQQRATKADTIREENESTWALLGLCQYCKDRKICIYPDMYSPKGPSIFL